MAQIYENAPVTVDVLVWEGDGLITWIETVTRDVTYSESMPEPNDLLGAVEERGFLTFSGFDRLQNP